MPKRKFTSWGVSFASLALVAGMMSYMGITNKETTSTTTTVATVQNSAQSSQNSSNQDSSVTYEIPSQSTDTSTSTDSSESTDTIGTGQQDDHSFPGQHGGFDTTTGGT